MSVVYKDLPAGTIYTPYREMFGLIQKNESLTSRVLELEEKMNRLLNDR
jgi:hypothetical protein